MNKEAMPNSKRRDAFKEAVTKTHLQPKTELNKEAVTNISDQEKCRCKIVFESED
jgi:hypothetical protein